MSRQEDTSLKVEGSNPGAAKKYREISINSLFLWSTALEFEPETRELIVSCVYVADVPKFDLKLFRAWASR